MLKAMREWQPPAGWLKITTVDGHTGGEPFRVITGGYPDLPGETILERRRFAKEHLDHLRTMLMWEPRGHADMYGCIVTPPVTPGADTIPERSGADTIPERSGADTIPERSGADIGVLFMHNEGYSTMCGHGIIGIAKVALETGLLPMHEPETTVRIDTPAGLVTARARVSGGQVTSVAFQNVPSFVLALDETVHVPGLGPVRYDLAFGGAFYAYVRAGDVGLNLSPGEFRPIIEKGMAIKRAIMAGRPIPHPFEEDLSFLYGTILVGPPHGEGAGSRNVCVFAEGEVDRCPTGTGVSGRLALHHARGELGGDETIVVESIIGTRFRGRIVATTSFGPYPAIIPEIEGSAHITGRHEFLVDPADPLRDGFILR